MALTHPADISFFFLFLDLWPVGKLASGLRKSRPDNKRSNDPRSSANLPCVTCFLSRPSWKGKRGLQ